MNDELIKKLQEADIFTPVSREEGNEREAISTARAEQKHKMALRSLLADITSGVTLAEEVESLYNGTVIVSDWEANIEDTYHPKRIEVTLWLKPTEDYPEEPADE